MPTSFTKYSSCLCGCVIQEVVLQLGFNAQIYKAGIPFYAFIPSSNSSAELFAFVIEFQS